MGFNSAFKGLTEYKIASDMIFIHQTKGNKI